MNQVFKIIGAVIQGFFMAMAHLARLAWKITVWWGGKIKRAFAENRPQDGAAWLVGGLGLVTSICVFGAVAGGDSPSSAQVTPTPRSLAAAVADEEEGDTVATRVPSTRATERPIDSAVDTAPATETDVPTRTRVARTPTSVGETATAEPREATATQVPATATAIPASPTTIPPSATSVPPTATSNPPTATLIPPSATPEPIIPTEVPAPTATSAPPPTEVPPTAVPVPPTEVPVPTATSEPPPAPPAGGGGGGPGNPSGFECDPRGCQQPPDPNCPIKGNINSEGVKIYHIPGWPNYDETRIDAARGERWFCTEQEARDAGWRAPLNV